MRGKVEEGYTSKIRKIGAKRNRSNLHFGQIDTNTHPPKKTRSNE